MIPVRLCLQGFMCYRDKTELSFDGATTWMLSGVNGAGKSTIFDAILFALYRSKREGCGTLEELIHPQADALLVEFDFRIGEDIYRARHTLKRGRRSLQHNYAIQHLSGPAQRAVPGRSGPQELPETDTAQGFKRWVKEHIGLDEKAFQAAVILRQGESDRLLRADAAERHSMLTQLLDLSRYQRLHEQAVEVRREQESLRRTLDQQLSGLPVIQQAQIDERIQAIEETEKALRAMTEQREALISQKQLAQRWAEILPQYEQLHAERAELMPILDQAVRIEQAADRARELDCNLPMVERFLGTHEDLVQAQGALSKAALHQKGHEEQYTAIKTSFDEIDQERQKIEALLGEEQSREREFERQYSELQGEVQILSELAQVREQHAELMKALSAFSPTLDRELESVRADRDRSEEAGQAYPWVQQYVRARTRWLAAASALSTLRENVEAAQAELETAQEDLKRTEADENVKAEELSALRDQLTQAKTRAGDLEEPVKRIEEVGHDPLCPYCGQPVDEAHVQEERGRRQADLQQALAHVRQVQMAVETLHPQHQQAQERFQQARAKVGTIEQGMRDQESQCGQLEMQWSQTIEEARSALQQIPSPYLVLWGLDLRAGPAEWGKSLFPGDAQLEELRHWKDDLPGLRQQLAVLEAESHKRDNFSRQLLSIETALEYLQLECPSEREHSLQMLLQQGKARLDAQKSTIESLGATSKKVSEEWHTLSQQERQAQQDLYAAQLAYERSRSRVAELENLSAVHLDALPSAWREAVLSVTKEQMTTWYTEQQSLQGAFRDEHLLIQARTREPVLDAELRRITGDIERIPEGARIPVATIEQQVAYLRGEEASLKNRLDQHQKERHKLQAQYEHRDTLEHQRREAVHQRDVAQELARLLGEQALQRFLLEQVEEAIVEQANVVLDRLSSGTARLVLRRLVQPDQESQKSRETFELLASLEALGGATVPAASTSGSERFRIAVSLAMGIGRYLGAKTRPIETLIIDEGFGSLDSLNREMMIDFLHGITEQVSRLLLVSHQEEVAQSFPHHYLIQRGEGTSRVQLVS